MCSSGGAPTHQSIQLRIQPFAVLPSDTGLRDYTAAVRRKLIISAAIAGLFLVVAALGEDMVVFMLGALALLLHFAGVLLSLVMRRWADLRLHVARCGIWLVTLIALGAIWGLHQGATRTRGEAVIAACEGYRAKHGRYPETLGALVPDYLAAIPPASDRLLRKSDFRYRERDGAFTLGHAGFAINYQEYDSRSRRWQLRD